MNSPSSSSRATALALGLAAAALFVLLASVRIEAQGPQYDELHQAVGAFTWLGAPPSPVFCMDAFDRVCVLNMPYSAAIKTNLYGAWLRFVQPRFTLANWRLFGLLTIALGIVLFCAFGGPALPPWAMAVFLALLLTDGAVLLAGRFDWGPVALSLAIRLALLGLWIGSEAGEAPTLRSSFGLGALVGFALFEKLSAVVLVPPLAAMVLGSPGRRERRHLLAAAAGLATGTLPLAAVHLGVLLFRGQPVSLGGGPEVDRSPAGFLAYVGDYLRLGQGGFFRSFILGLERLPWAELLEGAVAAAVCAVVAAAAVGQETSPSTRRAWVALVGYGAVCLGLYLLPRPTWAHHWLLGTPFQYTAVALALPALRRGEGRRPALGLALVALTALLLAIRLPGLVETERALGTGRASSAWDPSLAEIGRFAAERPAGAVFVASDWGVATQILAFSGGLPGLVYEPFWRYDGPAQLRRIQEESGARILYLYLVRLRNPRRVVPGATERIERDLEADPRWREVPAEPEAAGLREVLVRKFVPSGLGLAS
ncbi:MAG TPA: hypothetical protein VE685_18415 [Thermoanaerobaculia bacterium]|nr:hypothetical protein [Thermoanaerobaculia bacterium]